MNKTKVVFEKCSNYYRVVVNGWNFGRIIEGKYEWKFTTLGFRITATEKVLRKITKKLELLNGGEEMSELKPCPFCGGKNVLSTELQDGLPFIAYCQCGAENEAENWNTRPIEDALQARIAELESAQRWRVVADGELPNKNDYYLARDDLGQQGMILFYDGEWNKFTNLSYITLWMPLPKSPEVQE